LQSSPLANGRESLGGGGEGNWQGRDTEGHQRRNAVPPGRGIRKTIGRGEKKGPHSPTKKKKTLTGMEYGLGLKKGADRNQLIQMEPEWGGHYVIWWVKFCKDKKGNGTKRKKVRYKHPQRGKPNALGFTKQAMIKRDRGGWAGQQGVGARGGVEN